ncbi:SGNH/GDSL hydrolase family protein [Saccharophagus degradans]|uniref:SGNH/GDSL hydrolase family protein n=1 Tax=Saccharophagus degradans TaxID=86304 RepID=UPI001C0966F8|nr:SGNH/GDSL hydrolase family protein [Saccharophagus degradans]MBU2986732.1 SGNH/GDSL hydrolase family protein [Saccharophagus degradans]WGO98502.1 SGNH/GDSL hydrolase family protein [Saccharophagus degradans]
MKIYSRLIATGLLLLSGFSFAHSNHKTDLIDQPQQGFGELVIFGGVFTDTGNFASLYGDLPGIFWNNRFANGPVISDYMAETLGLSASPSLHVAGEVSEPMGTNYSMRNAWAGQSGELNISGQVQTYLASKDYSVPADSLIFMWAGSHDVIEAITTPAPLPYQMLDDAVFGIEAQLYLLIDSGAQHIFAPTFADVGFLPAMQRRGIEARVTEATDYFNRKFSRMLNRVERNTGQRIYRFDFDRYVKGLVANAGFYGIKNSVDVCVEQLATGGCDFNSFLFMTDVLITSKTHKLIADAFTQDLLHQVSYCKRGNYHSRTKHHLCPSN